VRLASTSWPSRRDEPFAQLARQRRRDTSMSGDAWVNAIEAEVGSIVQTALAKCFA